MNWYYEKDGEQSGPVGDDALQELFNSGAITVENLVWKKGMADWEPYGQVFAAASVLGPSKCPTCGAHVDASALIPTGDRQVCPECRDQYAQGLREGMSQPVRIGSRGTGGMTPNRELRAMARESLSGNWLLAALVTFLYLVLQQASGIIPLVGWLVQLAIAGPLALGYMAYMIGLIRREPVEVGSLFSGFSDFLRGFGIYFVTTVLASLAAFAAAIPGGIMLVLAFQANGVDTFEAHPMFLPGLVVAIIPAVCVSVFMYLRYSLVYFIANDEPDRGAIATIRKSVEMMRGHKVKLLLLYLSFIGWFILGMMALFIGVFWSMAYMWAALAAFYEDLGEATE